jgi:dolichol-phosphate mannosyltransferase
VGRRVALVMPAYNEQDGIVGFLDEVIGALEGAGYEVTCVVVDDHSTDSMPEVLDDYARSHHEFSVVHATRNCGHGPTALNAYREGLARHPDLLVFVDGDGQFLGEDIVRALRLAERTDVDVVHGVRTGRTDPWYRRMLTAALGLVIAVAAGARVPDVNTPLRVYRPQALRALLGIIPEDAVVPHVHFSLAEVRGGLTRAALPVHSIPRRGATAQGSMWGGRRVPLLPPPRLLAFVLVALRELWRWSLRPGSTARTCSSLRTVSR